MSMVFLKPNNFNTTTMAVVDAANTATVANIIDRKLSSQWSTVGYGTNTSTIFSIEFGTSTVIDRIFIQNHNLKQFRAFYDSATANTFSVDINETTNSETSNYYTFNTITVTSVQVQIDLGQAVDTEKAIGELFIGQLMLDLERNPSAADYKRNVDREQIIHRMPNGGVSTFIIDQKFEADLKWKYLTNSFTTQLKNVYDTQTTFFFVPFGTTSSWDGDAFHVAWTSQYDFRHSTNNKEAGFSGRIRIEEIA